MKQGNQDSPQGRRLERIGQAAKGKPGPKGAGGIRKARSGCNGRIIPLSKMAHIWGKSLKKMIGKLGKGRLKIGTIQIAQP